MIEEQHVEEQLPLANIGDKVQNSQDSCSQLKESNQQAQIAIVNLKEKFRNYMRMQGVQPRKKRDLGETIEPIVVVREPSNADSEELFIPQQNEHLNNAMKLINLENELSARVHTGLKDFASWQERSLDSESGIFTNSDPLLAFSELIFDFISKNNKELWVQLRTAVILADPSTFKSGGFSKKLIEVNTGIDMPPDNAKKMFVILASQLTTKSTLRIFEISQVYEPFVVGLVSYLHATRLRIQSEDLPVYHSASELFEQLARTFELNYSRQDDEASVLHVFSFLDKQFTIREHEGAFTGTLN